MILKLIESMLAFVITLKALGLLEVFLSSLVIYFLFHMGLFCASFLFVLFSLCHLFAYLFFFGFVYLVNSSRHGLWLIVSCGGGGVGNGWRSKELLHFLCFVLWNMDVCIIKAS